MKIYICVGVCQLIYCIFLVFNFKKNCFWCVLELMLFPLILNLFWLSLPVISSLYHCCFIFYICIFFSSGSPVYNWQCSNSVGLWVTTYTYQDKTCDVSDSLEPGKLIFLYLKSKKIILQKFQFLFHGFDIKKKCNASF